MPQKFSALLFLSLLTTLALYQGPSACAQQPVPLRLDATAAFKPAGPAEYMGGKSRAPDGSTLGVTDRYLTRDGKPWLPVMGELHYARVPEVEWEDAILQMKSAGVDVISTYVIWIHHEEIEGEWDWTGQRDLRHFAELCAKHGMLLYPRLGPWAHAEARNGGLPDWVVAQGPIRRLDPKFMAATGTFYREVGNQLQGLMWKDGGPVIGVQIENEYAMRGPGEGAPYLLALKKLAIESGFDVPLYTVTGWDNAVVPPGAFLPVYGGYPEAPWGASRTVLPPQEVYAFRFGSRVSGNMGMIGAAAHAEAPTGPAAPEKVPFLTAEVGGGNEGTYHRRPVLAADDIAAIMPVMLGSGVNSYGVYMFHGGQNPEGKRTTLQESQATQYPTDVPVKSYDFEAPIGEYGLERRSLRLMKNWNYFLNAFGGLLAPMPAYQPEDVPQSPADLKPLRWSVRTDGRAGFVFVNNYVRDARMPAHPGTQFTVELPGGQVVRIPAEPLEIPSGVYFAWPFGLDLDGVHLRYSTAQLMTRISNAGKPTYVFACLRAIRCELALDDAELPAITPARVRVESKGSVTLLTASPPKGGQTSLCIGSPVGTPVCLLLLAPEAAENTWKVGAQKPEILLRTSSDVFSNDETVTLRQLGETSFRFAVYPTGSTVSEASAAMASKALGTFHAVLQPFTPSVALQVETPAGSAPPVQAGPPLPWRPAGVAQAPSDAVWTAAAARWSVHLSPAKPPSDISNLFLRVDYTGDEARLQSGGTLMDDTFYDGEPWLLGLNRYRGSQGLPSLDLEVLPLRGDSPVYLPPPVKKAQRSGQLAEIGSIAVLSQYQLRFTLQPPKAEPFKTRAINCGSAKP